MDVDSIITALVVVFLSIQGAVNAWTVQKIFNFEHRITKMEGKQCGYEQRIGE